MAAVVCPGPQALRQAEVLRASLKGSFEDFNVGSSGWSSRQMLQDLYKSILLNELEFALDKKVEQDLWNSAFKSQIDFLRQQTKDNKGSKSSEIQAVLSLFLEAASGFYIQLLQELCLHYNLDLPGHAKSSHLGILEDGYVSDNLAKRPHTQSCYYVCQDCLVHLGDIARYCDDSNQAELFYRHALVLVPSNGQPYNQLAILASAKGDQLGTVYFYCRSIAVKNQFPAASTNLHKIFNKICSRQSTVSSSIDGISRAEFFHMFLQFHGYIYLDQDLSEARKLKDKITENFRLLLQQDVLKRDDYIRIVAISLFSLYHIKSCGSDDLEEFDCISKDNEDGWQLALEFAVDLFDAVLSQANNNDNSLQSHALVYISVFCQWIAGNSSSLFKEESIKSIAVWEKFAVLLNHLSSSNEKNQPEKSDIPLYEDWELHSFLPLNSIHKKLNFTIKKTKIENEECYRIYRLIQFGSKLSNHSRRILTKYEDVTTGLAKFSPRTETNTSETIFSLQETAPKSPGDVDLDTAGQKLPSLQSPAFLPQKASSPTPFAETSSLFNNTCQGAIGGPVQRSPMATPQVPQYSLFQSGWKAPLTSAFGTTGSSASPTTIEKPFSLPTERGSHSEQSPIGHKFVNQGPLLGSTMGEYQPNNNAVPAFQGASRSPGYSTPSPGSLDGFGLSENWGSGVWGPVKSSVPNSVPAPSQQVQSMWNQEFSPSQGMSPLQQLLHDQQKRKDNT